jgi:predicted helicase
LLLIQLESALGNPPYSGHSANKGEWISKLVRDYYLCDGKPLGERNPKWLQDDYVKFLRWGQWRIEQTGQGVLAFITNHGYLDNPTFRGMRQNLMKTFDEIYVLDLHGSAKRHETVPGSDKPDKNVFDIQQGVAIGIFVKHSPGARTKKKEKAPATVHHCELWGAQRQTKYDWLEKNQVESTEWRKLEPTAPHYLFIPQDTKRLKEYQRGWNVAEMMPVTTIGPNSHRDSFAIAFDRHEAEARLTALQSGRLTPAELQRRFGVAESEAWSLDFARQHLPGNPRVLRCLYRPFDQRFMLWGRFMFDRPREDLLRHLIDWEEAASSLSGPRKEFNLGLITTRQTKEAFSV